MQRVREPTAPRSLTGKCPGNITPMSQCPNAIPRYQNPINYRTPTSYRKELFAIRRPQACGRILQVRHYEYYTGFTAVVVYFEVSGLGLGLGIPPPLKTPETTLLLHVIIKTVCKYLLCLCCGRCDRCTVEYQVPGKSLYELPCCSLFPCSSNTALAAPAPIYLFLCTH